MNTDANEDRHKEKLRRIISERGLASHMNDTKWRELCEAVNSKLPFPPPYQVKRLTSKEPEPLELAHVPDYLGDWGRTPEATPGLDVEWIRVAPRYSHRAHALLKPALEDCSEQLRALLAQLRIPFVERDGFFTNTGTLQPSPDKRRPLTGCEPHC